MVDRKQVVGLMDKHCVSIGEDFEEGMVWTFTPDKILLLLIELGIPVEIKDKA